MRIGQLVAGRYRLEERIGSGGSGAVWRAVDEELGRTVALKHALSSESERGAERIKQLRREANILARVNHPNVVTLFDVVDEDSERWLVMEHVPARSLAERETLTAADAARYGAQLADALEAVHANGIVHRDIKPGNVLVAGDGRAKLGDFGISRVVHGDVTLTDTGLLAGTPGYVAPEVANGEDPTPASDVFSLGATLFAAVEGASPYGDSDNHFVLLRRAAEGDVAACKRAGKLAPVLSAMLRVDPVKRLSAAEAKRMLDDVVSDDGRLPANDRSRIRRRPVLTAAVAITAILVVGTILTWVAFGFPFTEDDAADAEPSLALGDPRTADPCALLDATALTRFGDAELVADYGNFDRCDVIVEPEDDTEVDVELRFDYTEDEPLSGKVDTEGTIEVARHHGDGRECERTLRPNGPHQIYVTAKRYDDGRADLCAMADTAVDSAMAVLSEGETPRRAEPAKESLIHADACALLDADALSLFPGVDAVHPDAGFGSWECRWNSTTSGATLLLIFDRHQPMTAKDGRPVTLAGHDAFVEPDGYGDETCLVSVVHRQYEDADERERVEVELLLVAVMGSQPTEELCDLAVDLAEPAASSLPPA
ncbi:MAG: protein kinase domain-containing protein [Stackebrandtia sp.]